MRVTGQRFNGLTELDEFLGSLVEFPDQDGSVSGGGDQNLGILVFLLGVSGFNGGNPIGVALEVTNLDAGDFRFNFSHIHKNNNNK